MIFIGRQGDIIIGVGIIDHLQIIFIIFWAWVIDLVIFHHFLKFYHYYLYILFTCYLLVGFQKKKII